MRDGLKPVHRRILYAAHESGYHWNRKYVKSARPVADVMGKYHPHGDASIYDALVRMAQDWSLRVPLIDGQGNFGSIDGDPPAAMRYTESRLTKVAHELLEDIDKDTVDFQDNYDGTDNEPKVLPARFPNLLVNGSGGIAVGMATNIPPHNLAEVCNGAIALIDNPAIDLTDLMEIVPGPDFPTGGIILGRSGIYNAYSTGRGSIIMRGKVHIEEIRGDREAIIVTEVPYQVNKATMIEKMAELVRDKRIEGISDIRDESDRQGYRVVIELKRDAVADVVLNQLYRFTPLQTSFGANVVALNGGKPEVMTLIDMLKAFVAFREEVISRRTKFLLRKARDRAHVLVGLAIAVANIDEVIKLIRQAPDPQTAREQLMERRWPSADVESLILLIDDPRHRINDDGTYNLSEEQARAILALQPVAADRARPRRDRRRARTRSATRSRISSTSCRRARASSRSSRTSLPRCATSSARRAAPSSPTAAPIWRTRTSSSARTWSSPSRMRATSSACRCRSTGRRRAAARAAPACRPRTRISSPGSSSPTRTRRSCSSPRAASSTRRRSGGCRSASRSRAASSCATCCRSSRATASPPSCRCRTSPNGTSCDVMFATTRGTVRRNKLSDFVDVKRNGKIAMKFDEEGDAILAVETCTENDDVLLTAEFGQCIRFPVTDVRVFQSRDSQGVRGISLGESDRAISMTILEHVEATPAERAAYLKRATAERRLHRPKTPKARRTSR